MLYKFRKLSCSQEPFNHFNVLLNCVVPFLYVTIDTCFTCFDLYVLTSNALNNSLKFILIVYIPRFHKFSFQHQIDNIDNVFISRNKIDKGYRLPACACDKNKVVCCLNSSKL